MSYLEMVTKALKNRSVNSLAKEWGVKQKTLDRYVKGETLPDYMTAKIIAQEAGISGAEMLDALAEEEGKRRSKLEVSSEKKRAMQSGIALLNAGGKAGI